MISFNIQKLSQKQKEDKAMRQIKAFLRTQASDKFLKPEYRDNENPYYGHCYVASEVLFHKLGGKKEGYTVHRMNHENTSHWFIKSQNGRILDPTVLQFRTKPNYDQAKRSAFLTQAPSKRAQQMEKQI